MNQTVKDIISGFISGWTQVMIMQPFEIVKIRLQTQSRTNPYYHGIADSFKKIAKEEGLLAFYKGTVTPLIGIGFYSSAYFFTYQLSKRFLSRFKENPKDRLPIKYVALSGFFASFPAAFIACPVEHARIRIQIQKQGNMIYAGSVDAAHKIVVNHGVKGLFRGFVPTLGRQAIGFSSFFLVYETFLRATIRKDQKSTEAPLWASLFGGALAGIGYFSFAYPMDYIKTLLQTDNLKNLKYKTFRQAFFEKYREVGIPGLYTGITVTLMRAVFVNAGTLFAFEVSMRVLGRSQESQ